MRAARNTTKTASTSSSSTTTATTTATKYMSYFSARPLLGLVGVCAVGYTVASWALGAGLRVTVNGELQSRAVLWERRRGGKLLQVVTVPMVHLASRGFYEDVTLLLRGTVVLSEGVTPPHDSLQPHPLFLQVFNAAGLFLRALWQGVMEVFLASALQPVFSVVSSVAFELYRYEKGVPGYVVGQEYFDWLVLLVNPLAENADVVAEEMPLWKRAYFDYDFLVNRRNAHLLSCLDRTWYSRVSIPWGALHMDGIASGLFQRGYIPVHQRWVTVVSLPHAIQDLWRRFEGSPRTPPHHTDCTPLILKSDLKTL